MSFSGYHTDKILFWIWLILTFTILIAYWKKKAIKIYTVILLISLFLAYLPMGIPLFALYSFAIGEDTLCDYSIDPDHRIVEVKQIMATKPNIQLTKRYFIFEKIININLSFKKIESVSVEDQYLESDSHIDPEKAQYSLCDADSIYFISNTKDKIIMILRKEKYLSE